MFLDHLGAWSVILTSPLGNHSVAGLRILQDELTDFVVGPVMNYEMSDDRAGRELRSAYDYLFNLSVQTPPIASSISLYTHPDWKQPLDSEDAGQLTLASRLEQQFASTLEVPSWVASGQRSLERSVAKISMSDQETDVTRATRQGKEEALRFTADLFAKYASLTEAESAPRTKTSKE
jgi:hypothetical protein